MTSEDWKPSCSIAVLHVRAAMLRAVRAFFDARGYLEVETPCLSRDIVIDAWLEPFELQIGRDRWFLQTSPEAGMKRLLAAGSRSIYQLSRVFRKDEVGSRHNHEFTMIEWYGVGTNWADQLKLTEDLARAAVDAGKQALAWMPESSGPPASNSPCWPNKPFAITTYAEAFRRTLGIDVHTASIDELGHVIVQQGLLFPESDQPVRRDDLLNFLLGMIVEPTLGGSSENETPEFLCDYPPTQAALAVVSDTEPKVARRFELYVRGLELCNGYQELTDAAELQRRDDAQNGTREDEAKATLPGAPRLNAAMKSGLPQCSGVAMGFDRLVMLALGTSDIRKVLPFPGELA